MDSRTVSPGCRTGTSATAACTSASTCRWSTAAEVFRAFMLDAARPGGRARRVLLRRARRRPGPQRAAAADVLARARSSLFAGVKALFDPDDLLNPGVLVRPGADRRRPAPADGPARCRPPAVSASPHDAGDFTTAVHRCVGVGKCRADTSAAGGFMCPSYLASGDEKDVTRGRARVLQELTNGALIRGLAHPRRCTNRWTCACPARHVPATARPGSTWPSTSRRCCTGRYRRRAPARSATTRIGWLPRWLAAMLDKLPRRRPRGDQPGAGRPAAVAAPAAAPAASTRGAQRTDVRARPPSAGGTGRPAERSGAAQRPEPVVLWADSFTDGMNPAVAAAAHRRSWQTPATGSSSRTTWPAAG